MEARIQAEMEAAGKAIGLWVPIEADVASSGSRGQTRPILRRARIYYWSLMKWFRRALGISLGTAPSALDI